MIRRLAFITVTLTVSIVISIYVIQIFDIVLLIDNELWDFNFIKVFASVSVVCFIIINMFGFLLLKLEKTLDKIWSKNLNTLYGYVIGTVIYFLINLTTYNLQFRILTLLIPLSGILIGYYFIKGHATNAKVVKKRIVLISNIIIMTLWLLSVFSFNLKLKNNMNAISKTLDDQNNQLKEVVTSQDSIIYLILSQNLIDITKNDTINGVLSEQFKLHSQLNNDLAANTNINSELVNIQFDIESIKNISTVAVVLVFFISGLFLTKNKRTPIV
jgi:hypothetical protein